MVRFLSNMSFLGDIYVIQFRILILCTFIVNGCEYFFFFLNGGQLRFTDGKFDFGLLM